MFNRPPKREAWGGGTHFITSFYEYLKSKGYDVVFSLQPGIDLIFMFNPRPNTGNDCVNSIYRYKIQNPNVKIIQRINDTDKARPNDTPWRDELFLSSSQIADSVIFISSWLKKYYISLGFNPLKKNKVIINGCNYRWYFPDKEKNCDKDKVRLITHHWSDNYMKGFDVYNFIDDLISDFPSIEFTYMGRYNKLYSIKNTKLIPPKYGPEVGKILRESDIYVTAARWEACGMHHIEAARCGLPILYHRDGGGVSEVCRNHGLEFSNLSEFKHRLDEIIDQYDKIRNKIDYDYLSSERCFKEYEEIILETINHE